VQIYIKMNYRLIFVTIFLLSSMNEIPAQVSYSGLHSWYHPHSISMAGSGFGIVSVESDIKNPALLNEKKDSFDISILYYPVQINAGLVSVSKIFGNRTFSMSLRYMDYGLFSGFDEEGISTGSYTSQESWVTVSMGERKIDRKFAWGATLGGFFTQLESYRSNVITITIGTLLYIDKMAATVGLSMVNNGVVIRQFTNNNDHLPVTFVGSFTKKLKHLPLEISLDIGKEKGSPDWIRLGGIFTLNHRLQLRWGTSSDKLKHKTGLNMTEDYLGSTGAGISYGYNQFNFDLSGFFLGTGGWISGFSLTVLL